MPFDIPQSQWRYLRHWLILLLIVEASMFIFNKKLFEIYSVIGVLFLGGFLLRCFKVYPGEKEPLELDLSGFCLALFYALLARFLGASGLRFVLILTSSAIIIPHFLFIIKEK